MVTLLFTGAPVAWLVRGTECLHCFCHCRSRPRYLSQACPLHVWTLYGRLREDSVSSCSAGITTAVHSLRRQASSSFQTLASRGCFLWEPKPTCAKVRKSFPCLQNLRRCRPACSTECLHCFCHCRSRPRYLSQTYPIHACDAMRIELKSCAAGHPCLPCLLPGLLL